MTNSRTILPKLKARIFRPSTNNITTRRSLAPQPLLFEDIVNIETRRYKGLEHEETALFGGVAELNLGTDPSIKLMDNLLQNDHIEIFYEDIAQKRNFSDITGGRSGFDIDLTDVPPKFTGAIWKSSDIQKPSQVTAKINSWNYLRLLQYINIPRDSSVRSSTTSVKTRLMREKKGERLQIKTEEFSYRNDFLDYVDHALNTYLENLVDHTLFGFSNYEKTSSTRAQLTFSNGRSSNSRLDTEFYRVGTNIDTEFREYEDVRSGEVSTVTNLEGVTDLVEGTGLDDIRIIKFMDTHLEIPTDISNIKSKKREGVRTHVVGEFIVISQFALARLLTGAVTYDHGLNKWFTPVLDLSSDLAEMIQDIQSQKTSKLVYCRFRYALVNSDNNKSVTGLQPLVNFNIDTFPILNFFNTIEGVVSQSIAEALEIGEFDNQSNIPFDIPNYLGIPQFLSLIFATIPIVQDKEGKGDDPYRFVSHIHSPTNGMIGSSTQAVLKDLLINDRTPVMKKTMQRYTVGIMQNSASATSFLHTVLSLDDKLVSYITNVPASYMRADIFTGSKFKVYSVDSLSIIRIIQLLVTSMRGFPATNNPQHGSSEGHTDSYPIFRANRIIIEPEPVYCTIYNIDEDTTYRGATSLDSIIESGGKKEVYFFLVLKVNYKRPVANDNEVQYKLQLEDVNDMETIRGMSLNHVFNFSFGEHSKYTHMFGRSPEESRASFTSAQIEAIEDRDDSFTSIDKNGVTMAYLADSSVGFQPSEFQSLTIGDMTQNNEYSSWANRASLNPNIDNSGSVDGYPIHNPILAYKINDAPEDISQDTTQHPYYIANFTEQENEGPNEITSTSLHQIMSCTQYVDISDLKREISYLKELKDDPDKQIRAIANTKRPAFDDIILNLPFQIQYAPVDVNGPDEFRIQIDNTGDSMNIGKFIDEMYEILQTIDDEKMAWLFPIKGHRFINTGQDVIIEEVSVEDQPHFFGNSLSNLFAITILDLVVKGLRYLLWSISKSRIVSHVYMPIENFRQEQGRPVSTDDALSNIDTVNDPLGPGSSITFSIDDDNVLQKALQKSEDLLSGIRENPMGKVFKRVEDGQHQLRFSSGRVTADDILIWYVSKKIVYMGEDEGAMMRLLLTEGSFDWTVFYREDTMMTRIAENFLVTGIGNVFNRGFQ